MPVTETFHCIHFHCKNNILFILIINISLKVFRDDFNNGAIVGPNITILVISLFEIVSISNSF